MSRRNESLLLLLLLVLTLAGAAFVLPRRPAESASGTLAKSVSSCEHEAGSGQGCEHETGSPGSCDHESGSSVSGLAAVSAHGSTDPSSPDHEAKILADALRKKPDHIPVLIRMAGIAAARKDFETALTHLRTGLKHMPDNPELSLELGRVLFEKGDTAAAIVETQRLLKRHPRHPDGLYNLGAIHANLGNREKAEKCWKDLLAANPDSESGRRARLMLSDLQKSPPTDSAALQAERFGP